MFQSVATVGFAAAVTGKMLNRRVLNSFGEVFALQFFVGVVIGIINLSG